MDKRRRLYIILGALAVLIVAIGCLVILKITQSNEYKEQLSLGDKYLQELDYENAEICYQAAIRIDEKHVKPYIQLSNVYVAQGRYEDAVKILERANEVLDREYQETVQKQMDKVEESRNASTAIIETPEPEATATPTPTPEERKKAVSVQYEQHYSGSEEYAVYTGYDDNGEALWVYGTEIYPATELDRTSEIGIQNGNTLSRIETLNSDYYWPMSLDENNGEVRVIMSMGPGGMDGEYPVCVNTRDYSYYME